MFKTHWLTAYRFGTGLALTEKGHSQDRSCRVPLSGCETAIESFLSEKKGS